VKNKTISDEKDEIAVIFVSLKGRIREGEQV
jgi:hypothetical protein